MTKTNNAIKILENMTSSDDEIKAMIVEESINAIMTLLRHGDISAGRAAELLEIERWQLDDLMDSYKISPFPTQTKEELLQEVTQTLEILNQHKK